MPYSEEVQQHLAETYIKLNQKDEAVAILTQLLNSSEDQELQKPLRAKLAALQQTVPSTNSVNE
jgi:thioredoxin-like negative regulator of GroEL